MPKHSPSVAASFWPSFIIPGPGCAPPPQASKTLRNILPITNKPLQGTGCKHNQAANERLLEASKHKRTTSNKHDSSQHMARLPQLSDIGCWFGGSRLNAPAESPEDV